MHNSIEKNPSNNAHEQDSTFLGYSTNQIHALSTNVAGKAALSFLTHPLYRTSVRQVGSVMEPTPLSAPQAFRKMWTEGGVKALGKGLVSGVTRETGKTFLKGPTQLTASQFAHLWFPDSPYKQAGIIGVASGTIPSFLLNPVELYKIRTMSSPVKMTFPSFIQQNWVNQKGSFGNKLFGLTGAMLKGYPPTALKETGMNILVFGSMPMARRIAAPYHEDYPVLSKIFEASISGIFVAGCVAPFDVVKTLSQKEGDKKVPIAKTLKRLHQISTEIYPDSKTKGLLNFFKRLLTGVPAKGTLTFISYTWTALVMGPLVKLSENNAPKTPSALSNATPSSSVTGVGDHLPAQSYLPSRESRQKSRLQYLEDDPTMGFTDPIDEAVQRLKSLRIR